MKRILFTHSYFLRLDPKQWKVKQPYAPLGTLYAAAVMRELGYEVKLHDVQFSKSPRELLNPLVEFKPQYLVIYDDGFNYLTKMCLTNMREAAFEMIRMAKEKGVVVIVSSSDATDHFVQYLEAGADFVLLGEGEQTLAELILSLEAKDCDTAKPAGLAYQSDGTVVKTSRRAVMKNLDSLPLPAWDLVDLAPYRESWMEQAGYFSVNIATTRGCPFKCNWCAKPIYGNRYNTRSPQHVIAELRLLQQLLPFDHVWFCDDIFGLKPGWVGEFASLLKKEGLRFRFKIQSRADLLIDEAYVAALHEAGCQTVWMGAESGSQQILDAMDKGTTVEQIRMATQLLKKYRIDPCYFIQFGYPGENAEDIDLTIKLINSQQPTEIGISVSYPLPGTGFYEKVKNELTEKSNWTDSDELALMFRNTYPPLFYKLLHRYVHGNYKKHLAWYNYTRLLRKPKEVNIAAVKKIVSGLLLVPSLFIQKQKLRRLQKMI